MKIALLAMPFLSPRVTAIGLTQLKGRLKEVFGDRVSVRLFYLNHDFYHYFGSELYSTIDSGSKTTLLNEWVFRGEAFENIKPNHIEYFSLFYPETNFSPGSLEKLMKLGPFIRDVITRYNLASYDMVGINATFSILPGLAFCRYLKKVNPALITIMGGASLYQDMGKAIIQYYPHLDYVCSGSGLISFPAFVNAAMGKDKKAMDSIDGIFSPTNTGSVRGFGDELDINHPIPLDYDDFFESFHAFNFQEKMSPLITMETSRGCYWNKCTFCGLNEDQQKYRVKSTDTAIEEINSYFKKYNTNIEMVDNVMPRHYIKKVLPYLAAPENKRILYEVRGDYTEEEMETLHRAKVTMVQPGIESLLTSVHILMNKGVNAFQCISMLKRCIKYAIYPAWNLLIGFPGMTEEMYKQLMAVIPALKHIFPPGFMNRIRFDRYSYYWENSEKYQLKLRPFTPYEYVYPYGEQFLMKMAYFFEDRNFSSERCILLAEYSPKLDALVDEWKKRWLFDTIDHLPKLTIIKKDGKIYVYDSRQDTAYAEEYEISSIEEKILDLLEAPMNVDSLVSHFPGEKTGFLSDTLNKLDRKGLLFKENDRYLSLVIRDYPVEELKTLWLELKQIESN